MAKEKSCDKRTDQQKMLASFINSFEERTEKSLDEMVWEHVFDTGSSGEALYALAAIFYVDRWPQERWHLIKALLEKVDDKDEDYPARYGFILGVAKAINAEVQFPA